MDISENLQQADAVYERALIALDAVRGQYLEGSGQTYAALLLRQTDLLGKIAAHKSTAEQAEANFKRLFAAANYVRTKEVKAALFEKNDALSMADELGAALQQVEAASVDPKILASSDAQRYLQVYDAAYVAYARRSAWQALNDHAAPIADALALLAHAPTDGGTDRTSADPAEMRTAFVWTALLSAAKTSEAWCRRPTVEELGALDLGPFAEGGFVSPAEAHLARKRGDSHAMQQEGEELPA